MKLPDRDQPIPEGPYDLAVVGGGINGVAIARDAVLRGHSVVLFEKGDLSSGTSGCSSKMIHGGIRYLEHLRFGLVYEALRERHLLRRLAPHLVDVRPFIIPVYDGDPRGLRWIRLGLWLYDKLCLGRRLGKSSVLAADEVTRRVPDLLSDGLLGGGLYWDAVMDDARLVLANAQAALEEAGSRGKPCFIRTYTEVVDHRATTPASLTVRDRLLGEEQQVLANRVVYAVGPWTDARYLTPSKGIHLVLPPLPMREGLLLQHRGDGRVFFVVPWRGLTVVGTTETPFAGNPDDVAVDREDVDYLLAELRRLFPRIIFGPHDILGVYAGVRPLARRASLFPWWPGPGAGSASRVHRIVRDDDGTYRVFGGKYTTYRNVARRVVDAVFGTGGCETHRRPLPGGEEGDWSSFRSRCSPRHVEQLGEEQLERLFRRYGARCRQILRLAAEEPQLAEPLIASAPELRAEVVHAARHELVFYPEDFLCRRTTLAYGTDGGRQAYDAVEELVARHARLSPPDLPARRGRYFDARRREDQLTGKVAATT